MQVALAVVWTIGLLGALPATLVILKLASLVVYTLLDIAALGVHTRRAARGIAMNLSTISRWPDLGEHAGQLTAGARRIQTTAGALHAELTAL